MGSRVFQLHVLGEGKPLPGRAPSSAIPEFRDSTQAILSLLHEQRSMVFVWPMVKSP